MSPKEQCIITSPWEIWVKKAAYARERYLKKIRDRVCVRCSVPMGDQPYTRCEKCRLKQKLPAPMDLTPNQRKAKREASKRLYHSRRARGECVICGDSAEPYARCANCRQMIKERKAGVKG